MNKLVFATNNAHKLQEIREILSFGYTVYSLNDLHITIDIPETGATFKENALIKAEAIYNLTQQNCFADDSGLSVNALNGEPGVLSARYAGEQGNDALNRKKLLLNMNGLKDRSAAFYTVICLLDGSEKHYFEGKVVGSITDREVGTNGFGYDSVFIPEGFSKTFAEMMPEEKNAISHRANAVKKMADFLKQIRQ